MWQFGSTTTDNNGNQRFHLKRAKLLTSSRAVADRLRKRCPRKHKHVVLLNGRVAAAAQHIDKLCIEISTGIEEQFEIEHGRCANSFMANVNYGAEPLEARKAPPEERAV